MYATAGAIHATMPWADGRKAVTYDYMYYGSDTKARIQICLSCEMPNCINCFDERKQKYKPRTERKQKMCLFREKFRELYKSGMTKKDMCIELKISESSYRRYERELLTAKENTI